MAPFELMVTYCKGNKQGNRRGVGVGVDHGLHKEDVLLFWHLNKLEQAIFIHNNTNDTNKKSYT